MNIGSVGIVGSFSTGQLQQARGADADRAAQDARTQARGADSARQAEAAAGIGQTMEDEGASDRDADGRRLWERAEQKADGEKPSESGDQELPHSRDPSGDAGGTLDLTG